MNYRLVLCDFDYTLVDASACLLGALKKALESIGLTTPDAKQLKALIGIPLEDQFRVLAGLNNEQNFDTFTRTYAAVRDATEGDGTTLLPGVANCLATLRRVGLQVGIVSTGARPRIRRSLERFGLMSYFGEVGVVGGAADKASAIREAMKRRKVNHRSTIYVGDRPDDGEAADRACVSFVAVTTGAFGASDFPEYRSVLPSIGELPQFLFDRSDWFNQFVWKLRLKTLPFKTLNATRVYHAGRALKPLWRGRPL
jgi:phosphoglycolate phosphatase